MGKKYKSIKTIMEKAKNGELDFETAPTRLYSNIQYNVKKEIIKPYLHYLDERSLGVAVDRFIGEPLSHYKIQELATKYNKKLISPGTLTQEMLKIYEKFPKEVINDIFNINYEDINKLKFEDRKNSNKFRYQMIEKSNNPVAKVITRHNNLKSMIYTRSMIQYFLMMMAILQQEDKSAFDDLMDNLKGSGDSDDENDGQGEESTNNEEEFESDQSKQNIGNKSGNGGDRKMSQKELLDILIKRFDELPAGKSILDEVLDNAKKTTDMIDTVMTDKQLAELWQNLGGNIKESLTAASKLNKQYLEKIESELKKVNLNITGIKSKIKNLLDKSISYFSSQEKVYFENIFDAGTIDGLRDIELFHPLLRKVSIEDINVRQIKRMGKIDIYIDASGSMNNGCGIKGADGKYMTKLLFAKAFTYKMKELNLLNNIYSFQNSVRFEGNSIIDVLNIAGGGGTTTYKVIESINKHTHNAIVITDAEDRCDLYSDRAFFIGVHGANFRGWKKEYLENNQAIVFDGREIFNIDSIGDIIR